MAANKGPGGVRDRANGVAITTGIAHVSFSGGSVFLPARTPYDRQVLLEHIVDRARAKERVQVLLEKLRWMVHLRRGPATAYCSACGRLLNAACYSTAEDGQAHCLGCAFGNPDAAHDTSDLRATAVRGRRLPKTAQNMRAT